MNLLPAREGLRFDPVLLDLDGTLVDSAPAILASTRWACEAVGRPVPADADLSFCVGPPLEDNLVVLLGDPGLIEAAARAYRERYPEEAAGRTPAMAGAGDALGRLRAAGAVLAVVTYKLTALAELQLAASGLAESVDLVVGRDGPSDRRSKAELLRAALGRLEAFEGRPLYVGDHEDDRAAAEDAGVAFLPFGGPWDWDRIGSVVLQGGAAPAAGQLGTP